MIGLLYSLFEGVWRDCFGKDGWGLPIIKHRAVQHIIGFIVTFCFGYFAKGLHWAWAIYLGAIVQGLIWAPAIGPWFDIGTAGMPDKNLEERYNKAWYTPLLDKIMPESMRFGMIYDFTGFMIRYTAPFVLLLPILHWACLFAGLVNAVIYTAYRYSTYDFFMKKYRWADNEILSGLCIGFFIAFC
jgi:hypothetical protein